jgi:Uma2 family endonuclease
MNFRATTRAAEGLPRRAFTVEEVERMVEVGLIEEDERLELLGGELVPMSPKGYFHERLKIRLNLFLARNCPDRFLIAQETTFRLSDDTFVEPDFLVFPTTVSLRNLKGPDAALAIEVADSSLGYDLGRKPRIYSQFGVAELWVIDAQKLVTHVHRGPTPEGYAEVTAFASDALLTPSQVPELALRLASLDLGP